jgi:pimeloyl-ACP methyl ester carboxylesterase
MVLRRKTLRVSHLGGIEVGYRSSQENLDHSKPTLVLFNPFTTTADYYLPEFQNEALLDAANLVAFEPLGHGHTFLQKAETFTYWDTAVMTLQALDKLGVEQVFAAGTSQGGWIAARMALLAPGRVCKLVLTGPKRKCD